MSQTEQDPSQQTRPAPSATSGAGGGDDPLLHLHKMSTTAGLGSGDYVAVNTTAVFTLIAGLASALSLLEPLLLVIPLAGLVAAVVAWRQISDSNGTQTGRALVVVGVLLMLGFGGLVFARRAGEEMSTRADRQAIGKVFDTLGQHVIAGNYADAYKLFGPRFTGAVDLARFESQMKFIRQSDLYGKLTGTTWNGLVQFQTDEATGTRYAVTTVQLNIEKVEKGFRENVTLRKDGSDWKIEGMESLFPPARPARGAPPQPGGPGGGGGGGLPQG